MEDKELLKKFMQEFFPFAEFKKAGLFTKEMKNDYNAQAEKICTFLGLKSIYEYRKETIRCHISEPNPKGNFITVIPSIYE
jgi:hypothetical protein